MDSDIQTLQRMLAQYEERLSANADFLAWRALSNAIAALSKSPIRPEAAATPKHKPARMSQADGALFLIERAAQPLRTQELLDDLPSIGVVVSGTNPSINLSSSLSRDSRLVSINWDGGKAWWIAGRDIPNMIEALI